ncbi:hypothetical protein A4A49_06023 [Nicotiana attenuata]|uniref:Uncharacterized protein n=1 Tax=Nicotiana attenuata TaxID=49451 RepID=A0A314KYP1_NICAT|nr:hypothetical protein A4A49_06023 [Nicotiana attenuata]
MPSFPSLIGDLPQKSPLNGDSKQPKFSTKQPPSHHFHTPTPTKLDAGVMDGDGPTRPVPKLANDGWASTDVHHNPGLPLLGTVSNPPSPPGFVQFRPLAMAIHPPPSPVHGHTTPPINGGAQLSHGATLPNNALLPINGPEHPSPITGLHNVATSEPTHSPTSEPTNSPTNKSGCSHEHANKGEEPNPSLPQRIQRRPRKHLGKARGPKNNSPPHAGSHGGRVQRAIWRNAYCSLPPES